MVPPYGSTKLRTIANQPQSALSSGACTLSLTEAIKYGAKVGTELIPVISYLDLGTGNRHALVELRPASLGVNLTAFGKFQTTC